MSVATADTRFAVPAVQFFGGSNGDGYFTLDDSFINSYKGKKPKFGYNGLGEFVYNRTYSRIKSDGSKEDAIDTFRRVVEGCYEIQRRYCNMLHISWTRSRAQASAQEMFQRIWDFKFLPPGRSLWTMGTDFMFKRGSACLLNCSFVSTANIDSDPSYPFEFLTDMSMLGSGVGFDTRGANKLAINKPSSHKRTFVIPDSREGWAESVGTLIRSYTCCSSYGTIDFDYSGIRPAGSPIKGFGGEASGSRILIGLHEAIRELLNEIASRSNNKMTSVDIVDIMNMIGKCVVAGNVRRSSELAVGNADDINFIEMKDYNKYPKQVESHRWASNNSVLTKVGSDYSELAKRTAINGEPGYIWIDNMRNYGRMIDGRQPGIDSRVMGTNPCGEVSLEDSEMCNLVEVFPANHDSIEDYYRTLKFAYLFGKTVTLLPTHRRKTNSVMQRNRRIGLSHSGVIQAFNKFGRRTVLEEFCNKGYDEVCKWDNIYSEWLCCSKSIKKTSLKPSGSVSLLTGSTAGIHATLAPSRAYWRRVRIATTSDLLPSLRAAGYHIEQDERDQYTSIVKFGISEPDVPSIDELSIWEQVENCISYQGYWSDNQVSCTIHFHKDEQKEITKVLNIFDDRLKSISFLPHNEHGYSQPPYEAATVDEVNKYNASLKLLYFNSSTDADGAATKFCDGQTCSIL